jgi:hypothetical protein
MAQRLPAPAHQIPQSVMLTEFANSAEKRRGVTYLGGRVIAVTALVPLDRPGMGIGEQGTCLTGSAFARIRSKRVLWDHNTLPGLAGRRSSYCPSSHRPGAMSLRAPDGPHEPAA